jgi:hypothetical protein
MKTVITAKKSQLDALPPSAALAAAAMQQPDSAMAVAPVKVMQNR